MESGTRKVWSPRAEHHVRGRLSITLYQHCRKSLDGKVDFLAFNIEQPLTGMAMCVCLLQGDSLMSKVG